MRKRFLMGWIVIGRPIIWCSIHGLLIFDTVKVADNVKSSLCGSMSDWNTLLKSSGEVLGEVGIKRRIFQGYSLSSLMFVLAVINLHV